jgi:hypothetical protein
MGAIVKMSGISLHGCKLIIIFAWNFEGIIYQTLD